MELTTLLFIGGLGPLEIVLISLVVVAPFLLMLWAIVDLLTSKFTDSTDKLIWALVIIFVPFLGSILYLIMGRKQKAPSNR